MSDVRSLHTVIKPASVDAIVTESYLGKPLTGRESRLFLQKQAYELADLYASAFHSFAKIIKTHGMVCIIIPSFRHEHDWIMVDCLEGIKKSGFVPVPFGDEQYLRYHRPAQHVARDIWRFKKMTKQ